VDEEKLGTSLRREIPYPALLGLEGKIMIKRVSGGYQVLSSKGKNLGGPYRTLEEAKKRLRQVEFFKRNKV
jgi:hypothetical protein